MVEGLWTQGGKTCSLLLLEQVSVAMSSAGAGMHMVSLGLEISPLAVMVAPAVDAPMDSSTPGSLLHFWAIPKKS